MDAVGLVELYKKGKIKPSETVEIYIAHQERFNSKLNLVIEDRYEKSRQEAGLIALGGAAAGLGSDIGGSIRIPAHFKG